MIDPTKIKECLAGLIGFKEDIDPAIPKPSEDNKASSSGIYVSHPLITMENIIANTQRSGNTADETLLNSYLSDKLAQGAVNLAHALVKFKGSEEQSKTVLGDIMLYTGSGNIYNTVVKDNRFVGYKIQLIENDISLIMSKIGLQLNSATEDLKLYSYHSSEVQPLKIWTLNYTKEFSFEWLTITTEILSLDTYPNGHFYIGYFESSFNALAISRKVKFTTAGCGSCDPTNGALFDQWSRYARLTPFYVNQEDLDDENIWNVEKEHYTDEENWGINLKFSAQCDVTPIICTNRSVLANALALRVAVDIIGDMAFSVRENTRKLNTQTLSNYALDNRENNTPGLKRELADEIKAMSFNFSGINPICLPCESAGQSISFGSVFS